MWANTFFAFFFVCICSCWVCLAKSVYFHAFDSMSRGNIYGSTPSAVMHNEQFHIFPSLSPYFHASLRTQPPTHEAPHEVSEMHEQILIWQQSGALGERQRCPVMNANTYGGARWLLRVLLQTGLPNNVALRAKLWQLKLGNSDLVLWKWTFDRVFYSQNLQRGSSVDSFDLNHLLLNHLDERRRKGVGLVGNKKWFLLDGQTDR